MFRIESGMSLGMIFIFAKTIFLMCGNGFQKTQFLQGKNGQNKPKNYQNQIMAKIAPKSNKFMKQP